MTPTLVRAALCVALAVSIVALACYSQRETCQVDVNGNPMTSSYATELNPFRGGGR